MDDCAADAAAALLDGSADDHSSIIHTLRKFGTQALQFAAKHCIRIVPLRRRERYDHRSPALKRLAVDVDAWPAPPAGLFVVEERTVYLRSRSPMTVAHEFGHALDCALGGGVYLSGSDEALHRLFAGAKSFVTPYAATGLDEYFAESLRAYVEVNDPQSFWPRATKTRLKRVDPAMFSYIEDIFRTEFSRIA